MIAAAGLGLFTASAFAQPDYSSYATRELRPAFQKFLSVEAPKGTTAKVVSLMCNQVIAKAENYHCCVNLH